MPWRPPTRPEKFLDQIGVFGNLEFGEGHGVGGATG
jgi:hypothetical protein